MSNITEGDMVINEYNHVGKVISINNDETTIDVINYTSEEDIDYCSTACCRIATNKEVLDALTLP